MIPERSGKRDRKASKKAHASSAASGGFDISELVRILSGMDFDEEKLSEIDCPSCGEHVRLRGGKCPACSASICDPRVPGTCDKVMPVVKGGPIVFLHLDVEAGCLDYLESSPKGNEPLQLTLNFDEIDPEIIDEDWEDSVQ